jgi:hypothetical protein
LLELCRGRAFAQEVARGLPGDDAEAVNLFIGQAVHERVRLIKDEVCGLYAVLADHRPAPLHEFAHSSVSRESLVETIDEFN